MLSFNNYLETREKGKDAKEDNKDAKKGDFGGGAKKKGNDRTQKGVPFGYMAGYDIYGAKGPMMDNSEASNKAIKKFLVALVKELGMIVAEPPLSYMSSEREKETMMHVGASAFIPLEDSGIQMHTIVNAEPAFACIDVFSCKEFEPKKIAKFLKKEFQTDHIHYEFIHRGREYNDVSPTDPDRCVTHGKL